ncbi:MAG: hypothetical protein J5822_05545 [Eubacteriaceae bacterium]|nr:hypothetical protein [Eubacteriaceae bacterium]
MALACKLKGHKFSRAGVCVRCGQRCDHHNLDSSDPCVKRCADCGRTFTEHLWEDYGEPGNRRCTRCGAVSFDPLKNANWKAKREGKVYLTGNMKSGHVKDLSSALKYASDSEYGDPAKKAAFLRLSAAVNEGYAASGDMALLQEAVSRSIKMYSAVPGELGKYLGIRDELQNIISLYERIETD